MQPGEMLIVFFTIGLIVVVIGGAGMIAYAFASRQRLRELAIRERIAMIEHGLVPPPEVDPAQFDRVDGESRRATNVYAINGARISTKAQRYRSAGVVLMGLGFGLLMLLGFAAGAPEIGFGVGGGIAALGAAVFMNGVLLSRDADQIGDMPIRPRTPTPPPNGR